MMIESSRYTTLVQNETRKRQFFFVSLMHWKYRKIEPERRKKEKETEITPHINLLIAARTSPTTNIQTAVCKQNKITGIKGQ